MKEQEPKYFLVEASQITKKLLIRCEQEKSSYNELYTLTEFFNERKIPTEFQKVIVEYKEYGFSKKYDAEEFITGLKLYATFPQDESIILKTGVPRKTNSDSEYYNEISFKVYPDFYTSEEINEFLQSLTNNSLLNDYIECLNDAFDYKSGKTNSEINNKKLTKKKIINK